MAEDQLFAHVKHGGANGQAYMLPRLEWQRKIVRALAKKHPLELVDVQDVLCFMDVMLFGIAEKQINEAYYPDDFSLNNTFFQYVLAVLLTAWLQYHSKSMADTHTGMVVACSDLTQDLYESDNMHHMLHVPIYALTEVHADLRKMVIHTAIMGQYVARDHISVSLRLRRNDPHALTDFIVYHVPIFPCSAARLEAWRRYATVFMKLLGMRVTTCTADHSWDFYARKCAQCATECAKFKCSLCKEVWYCDKTCQLAHWKEHKAHCNVHA